MAYTKTNWVNDQAPAINATNLNNIEDGIANSYNVALLAVSDTAPSECSTGDKYYNTTTKKIYTATGTDTWGTTGVDPIEDIFYIVFDTKTSYSYDGTDLVSVGGGGAEVSVSTTQPTEDEILWINPDDVPGGALNPITNAYSVAQDKGYSCNYVNEHFSGELLWQNSNISNEFSAQTISFDDTYSYYDIIFAQDSSALITQRVYTGDSSVVYLLQNIVGGYNRTRAVQVNTNSLVFDKGQFFSSYHSATDNNYQCIPYKVIGYK